MSGPTRLRDVLRGVEAELRGDAPDAPAWRTAPNPGGSWPTDATWTRWLGTVDGCPACVANVEAPIVVGPAPGGYVCEYRCADCGHAWTTAWWDEA